jgi:hypothetical protein
LAEESTHPAGTVAVPENGLSEVRRFAAMLATDGAVDRRELEKSLRKVAAHGLVLGIESDALLWRGRSVLSEDRVPPAWLASLHTLGVRGIEFRSGVGADDVLLMLALLHRPVPTGEDRVTQLWAGLPPRIHLRALCSPIPTQRLDRAGERWLDLDFLGHAPTPRFQLRGGGTWLAAGPGAGPGDTAPGLRLRQALSSELGGHGLLVALAREALAPDPHAPDATSPPPTSTAASDLGPPPETAPALRGALIAAIDAGHHDARHWDSVRDLLQHARMAADTGDPALAQWLLRPDRAALLAPGLDARPDRFLPLISGLAAHGPEGLLALARASTQRDTRRAVLDAAKATGCDLLAFHGESLLHPDGQVVARAVAAIDQIGGAEVPRALAPVLGHPSPDARRAALNALVGRWHESLREPVAACFEDSDASVRASAFEVARSSGDSRMAAPLLSLARRADLHGKDDAERAALFAVLAGLRDPRVGVFFRDLLLDPNITRKPTITRSQVLAIEALRAAGNPSALRNLRVLKARWHHPPALKAAIAAIEGVS